MVDSTSDASTLLPTAVPGLASVVGPAGTCWLDDATLVLADLAGFTHLTERFSARGRAGTEEVTAAVSGAFGAVLGAADAEGGDLLKFGGDALLLLFRGPGHEVRGCRAARELLTALAATASVAAPGGAARLRMAVGVHSGPAALVVASDRPPDLIVTGPAATATVDAGMAARPGEIVVSQATALRLALRGPTTPTGGVRLLRTARLPAGPAPKPPGPRPAAAPLRSRGGDEDGEHRLAAVGFVRFRGTDALLERAGPDALAVAVDTLVRTVQALGEELGIAYLGSDIDVDGGKLLVAAGAPGSGDDDAGRMLRFAHRIVAAGSALPVSVGVHCGPVFAGEVGPPGRRLYTVMGDTVNSAARLAALAAPGEAVTSATTLDRAAARFVTRPLGTLAVRGRSTGIDAAIVVDEAAAEAPVGASVAFVGRAAELAQLEAWLDDGEPGVVVVEGEAGGGKTRLVAELASRRPQLVVHRAFAARQHRTTPWHVAGNLLRSALGAPAGVAALDVLVAAIDDRAPALRPWTPLIARVIGAELPATPETEAIDQRFAGERLAGVVDELLAALDDGPQLVVVEQAQWTDEASLQLVRALGSTAGRQRLVVLTSRPGGPAAERTIAVAPLRSTEAAALVHTAAGDRPIRPHEVRRLLGLGAGNPLYLLELVAAWVADGEGVPPTLEALLTARIDRLPVDRRMALRDLSVLGPSAPRWLAERALGLAMHRAGLGLEAFLDGDDRHVWFRQELVRSVAYEGLSYARRKRLHGAVTAALCAERDGGGSVDDALLSYHALEARLPAVAWEAAVAAGDRAAAALAAAEAADLYERAVHAAAQLDSADLAALASVEERLGDARERLGDYRAADRAYASASRRAAGPADRARLLRKRARVRERQARYPAALRMAADARRVAATVVDPGQRAGLQATIATVMAGVHRSRGRLRSCATWCERAIVDAGVAGDDAALAHAWFLLEAVWADQGQFDRVEYRALPIYERLGDLHGQALALNNMGLDAYYGGRWPAALAHFGRSGALAERAGDIVTGATVQNNVGEILSDQGRHRGADIRFRDALRVFRAARFPVGEALAISNLGRAAARQGDSGAAVALLTQALERFEVLDSRWFVADTQARLGEAALLDGDVSTAARWVERSALTAGEEAGPLAAVIERLATERFRRSAAAARRFGNDYDLALAGLGLAATEPAGPRRERLRVDAWDRLEAMEVLDVRLPVPV